MKQPARATSSRGRRATGAPTTPLSAHDPASRPDRRPGARAGTTGDTTASAPERFARELAEHAPFPVALLVVIGIFLWIQNRIDRKDPKLAAAALDEETLRFE